MLNQLLEEWTRRYRLDPQNPVAYRGRFAPSPTGPLHLGSLVAALASWLDARAHGGVWLVRIEDLDAPREAPAAAEVILSALAAYGLTHDGAIVRQSARHALYRAAFMRLKEAGLIYPCGCTRREIADSLPYPGARGRETVYPGTCRHGLAAGRQARAWRVRIGNTPVAFEDRAAGQVVQNLAADSGDIVLLRADGQWAYQLAVVVDDADQGITHVVRGADLIDSTARQIYLQQQLGLPQPSYLHVMVVNNQAGEKLSKQTGAQALDLSPDGVTKTLERAARHLFG